MNDPDISLEWNHDATGIFDAWKTVRCNGNVTVAVIDSGVDPTHPDLAPNLILGSYAKNIVTGKTGAAAVSGGSYHGTAMAGIIAAAANNGQFAAGATYNAKILPIKTSYNDSGSGKHWWSDIIKGIDYVISLKQSKNAPSYLKNIKVINISVYGTEYSEAFQQAVDRAADAGILVFACAGNQATNAPAYPASFDHVVSVSAMKATIGWGGTDDPVGGSSGSIWDNAVAFDDSYSNYGSSIDLSAPGSTVYTTFPMNMYEGFGYLSGTSNSSPEAASVAALVFAANPDLTVAQVQAILTTTARDRGAKGRDDYYGFGQVRADAAVAQAKRAIKAVGALSGSLKVSGEATVGAQLLAKADVPAAQGNAWLLYQWFDAATGKAVSAKSASNALTVNSGLAGKSLYCVATDASGLYTGSLRSGSVAPKTFTVSFNANGGSAVAPQRVTAGSAAVRPADPVRAGYAFAGWFSDAALTRAYDFKAAVTGNMTLYAKWNGTGFTDVPVNHWAYVQGWLPYATGHALMGGYKTAAGGLSGTFGPEDPLTRGQVAVVLYRVANPGSDATSNPAHYAPSTGFKDQGAFPYYRAAIKWLKDNGVSTGDKDANGRPLNTFRPDDPITRQELAALVYRFARVQGVKTGQVDASVIGGFRDRDLVHPYAVEALAWCNKAGIVTGGQGADAGLLMPRSNATRAQAAKIFSVLHRDVLKL